MASKGMGIKTSVKSGNFRATKAGAGMTKKGCRPIERPTPVASCRPLSLRKSPPGIAQSAEPRTVLDLKDR